MAFSATVVSQAWTRAGGHCECTRVSHPEHLGRKCNKQLVGANRGRSAGRGAWEAHHRNTSKGDILSNCEILCAYCHNLTFP